MFSCDYEEQFRKNVLKYLVSGNKLDHVSIKVQISTLSFLRNLLLCNFYFNTQKILHGSCFDLTVIMSIYQPIRYTEQTTFL